MNTKKYWSSLIPAKKKALAVKLDTTVADLSNIFNGHRKAGAALCHRIVKATNRIVSLNDLRPDIFKKPK